MDRASLRAKSPSLIGTALYGAVRRVVWDPWLALVSHGDPIRRFDCVRRDGRTSQNKSMIPETTPTRTQISAAPL